VVQSQFPWSRAQAGFIKAAYERRGIVASVEVPAPIAGGEAFTVAQPELHSPSGLRLTRPRRAGWGGGASGRTRRATATAQSSSDQRWASVPLQEWICSCTFFFETAPGTSRQRSDLAFTSVSFGPTVQSCALVPLQPHS